MLLTLVNILSLAASTSPDSVEMRNSDSVAVADAFEKLTSQGFYAHPSQGLLASLVFLPGEHNNFKYVASV
jgi:hypothetical protein